MADSPTPGPVPSKPATRSRESDESSRIQALRREGHELGRNLEIATRQIQTERGRVESMRRSLSWRLTLPFRVLQRAWSGRSTAPPPPAPVTSPAAARAAEPGEVEFQWHLDQPSPDQIHEGQIRFRGWCLDAGGRPFSRLRIHAGADAVESGVHLPRPDVVMLLGLAPASLRCGFDLRVTIPRGSAGVTIEALNERDLRWRTMEVLEVAGAASRGGGDDEAAPYRAWLAQHDRFDNVARGRLVARCQALATPPRISILMPTWETAELWLRAAIESVRNQAYAHWQLCIADDASTAPHVRRILEEYSRLDARIVHVVRPERGHISAATNRALELADGDWITFLDHDDELHPAALACLALEIAAHPEAELIYTDEDKLDEAGRRSTPYFKPDWNPELIIGQNFVCHLAAYPAARLRALGGLRVGFEGCQDWDLVLRATAARADARVRHIPRVLYHWRMLPESTARDHGVKSYVIAAGERTLREHFTRAGLPATRLDVNASGHWRASYPLPEPAPLVSVLIPTRNQLEHLRRCVDSIRAKTDYPNYEIVVVDNQSDDSATREQLAHWERSGGVRVLPYDAPFNYAALHNFAVPKCRGELICLLNNDTEVISPRWLRELAGHAIRPSVGAVGAMLLYPDDTIQHAGIFVGIGGVAEHPYHREPRDSGGQMSRLLVAQNLSAVTGACLMIRASLYAEAGGLDETNLAIAYNDVDFCLRLVALGYRNVWTPLAVLYHHESVSRGYEDTPEKVARFRREYDYMRQRWAARLDHDPAYNPNLTLQHTDFGLAREPRVDPW